MSTLIRALLLNKSGTDEKTHPWHLKKKNERMETKRLIALMLLGMLVIFGWQPLITTLTHKAGYTLPPPATRPTETAAAPTTAAGLPGIISPATSPAVGGGGWTVGSAEGDERIQSIGSATPQDPNYAIQLAVSTIGAGLDRAVLNDYKLSLRSPDPFIFERPANAPFAEQTRALAVRSVTIDGATVELTGAKWTPVGQPQITSDQQQLTYELPLSRNGNVELVLRRDFVVYPRGGGVQKIGNQDGLPLGFEALVISSFVNKTDRTMNVSVSYNAPNVPPTEAERYADGNFIVGYATDGVVKPESHLVDAIKDPKDLLADANGRTPYWFGAATSYFMALHRFETPPQAPAPPNWFKSITSRTLTPEAHNADRRDEIVITTTEAAVAPGPATGIQSRVYFGPRKREYLTNAYYSAPWIQYNQALVIVSGICGICTWQWLIDILFAILKGFHFVLRDWGLSIIGLVFLVRLILHPITRKAQWNMLTFGKHAPEIAKIQERHKDDQDAKNRAMMAFYKEHGATQAMGCLPMFLQMPVWIALWQAMNTTFELRHQPFLYGWTWIHDLSKPDHLIDFANYGIQPIHLPLLSFVTISGINVLPFIYGLVQFIQFRIQPKPPTTTPEQAQQQAMTQWMILIMMPVILYASPSGLMIYMIASFGIGIVESKLVKRQFEHDWENKAKFKIIDADSPEATKAQKATVRRKQDGGPKKKGLFAIMEEARRRASEMQAEIEKNRKRPK